MRISILDHGHVELIGAFGDDYTIANVALMTRRHIVTDDDHLKRVIVDLIKKQHMTPFEFVRFHFQIKCPIFVARQLMRYRTWSYLEESRRYITDDPEFYVPSGWKTTYKAATAEYHFRLEQGYPPEQARIVLPLAMYTTYEGQVDARNLIHFLQERTNLPAQWETREFACAILSIFAETLPVTYSVLAHTFVRGQ